MISLNPRKWRCTRATVVQTLLVVAVAMGVGGCPSQPRGNPPAGGKKVDVGGYKIFYRDSGPPTKGPATGPTVILMSGLNDNLTVWNNVLKLLTPTSRVISYDRGGVGWSDEGINPRTGSMITSELHNLLEAIDAPPPYVLCAHSFAGLFARLYIRDYPNEVVGLVLVDTTHEDQYDRQAFLLQPKTAQLLENISIFVEDALASVGSVGEWMNRNNTFKEVRAARYLPDIPLYFLGQDFVQFDFLPDTEEVNASQLELNLYQDMSELAPRGILEIVPGVGHDIHEKAPDKVVAAINAVISGDGF